MKYTYNPIWFDKNDPVVISGQPIKPGSLVTITKSNIDPRGLFRFVIDEFGNRQSVAKNSLKRV
jgi:hypothetical protein